MREVRLWSGYCFVLFFLPAEEEMWMKVERERERRKRAKRFQRDYVGQEASGFSFSLLLFRINVFIYPHIHSLSLWCLTLGDLGGWLHGVRRKEETVASRSNSKSVNRDPFLFRMALYFLFFLVICYRFCHPADTFLWVEIYSSF